MRRNPGPSGNKETRSTVDGEHLTESPMPHPADLPPERDYERLNPGASADPPQPKSKPAPARGKNDAALPGSPNADLTGAKRDRRLRGATT